MKENELPWHDCKIAFSSNANSADDIWSIDNNSLPNGWELIETDSSCAQLMAIFRVEVLPTIEDGIKVSAIIKKLDKKRRNK